MKPEQIKSRITWLDEQRRKDSETISRLMERITSVEEDISKQSKQMQDISGDTTRLAAMASRIHQMDEALAKHRQEISRQLADSEKQRSDKEKAIEKIRKSDQKDLAKSLDELRKDVEDLDETRQMLDARRNEEIRITRDMDTFKKELDDFSTKDEARARTLASIEESRKKEGQRLGSLEAKTSDLHKKADQLLGEIESADDRIRRLEIRTSELAASENERKETQNLWFEQHNLRLVEFERSWKAWEARFDRFEQDAGSLEERMLSYEETYRNMLQIRNDLDDMLKRLERRINEITEMQRLMEDRLKQEWSNFQVDDQKRWSTYKLTADEQWRAHTRLHEKLIAEMQILNENSSDAQQTISLIKNLEQQRTSALLDLLRDWSAELE